MLTRVGLRKREAAGSQPETAVSFLLACHERLRSFVALAGRLAAAPAETPVVEVAETAAAIVRFFRLAAPLHVEDEELSLLPRLRTWCPAATQVSAERMHLEHGPIESACGALAAHCAGLTREPGRLEEQRPVLTQLVEELGTLLAPHFALEEEALFGAFLREVPQGEQAQALAEMKARRQG